jgi:hypothetical protein
LAVWFLTIKSLKSPWFPCVQVACHIPLESFWQGLKLCFRPHLHQRFSHKVMGLQSSKSSNFKNFGNFEIPTWECWDKMTFGCWPNGQAQRIL